MDESNDPTPSDDATASAGPGLSESVLSEDATFEALAHERRRYLLYALLDGETSSLEHLATKIAAREDGISPADVESETVEHVYASLYHAHVPKLVDLGVVEFDRRTEVLTAGANADQVLTVLELTESSDAITLENHARGDDND